MPNSAFQIGSAEKLLRDHSPQADTFYRALGYDIRADLALDGLPVADPLSAHRDPVSFRFVKQDVAWPPTDGLGDIHPPIKTDEPLPANTLVLANRSVHSWDWYTAFDNLPVTRVRCDLQKRTIVMSCNDDLESFRISYHFISPVLPYWARRDGRLGLHGAVIDIGGSAIVILGDKTMGKSTLCAAFHKIGKHIWSEDVAAISGDLQSVYRGSNKLRTNKETAQAIFGDSVQLQKCSFSKHVMDTGAQFADAKPDALPIAAIFYLSGFSQIRSPKVVRLKGSAANLAVLRNIGSTAFPAPRKIRESEFLAASTLGGTLPVFEVNRPRNLAVLSDTVQQMLEAAREVTTIHVG